MKNRFKKATLITALAAAFQTQAVELRVTVENLNTAGGLYFTPVWVGFHGGDFDLFDAGSMSSEGLERLAEDGDATTLRADFSGNAGMDDMIFNEPGFAGAPIFDPGQKSMVTYDLDPNTHQYFSYATMVIPSNDAFVGNDDAMAYQLFNDQGEFNGPMSFVVYGNQVYDAGTEANNEMDAAFFNQMAPNTGTATQDGIAMHTGFNGSVGNPDGTPVNFLGGALPPGTTLDAMAGDFTYPGHALMRITIQQAHEPVRVSIKNTADQGGTFLTPFWLGFHDGSYDLFNAGETASAALERVAEDGAFDALNADFDASGAGLGMMVTDPEGFAGAPLFDPGMSETVVVQLDPANNRYLSYLSMVLPSNDAFVGNDGAMAYQLFDEVGTFTGPVNIKIGATGVWDAGTEANTESDAAFFDQSAPDTGDATSDLIAMHPGFNGSMGNPDGMPQNFLGGTNGPGFTFDETAADFTAPGNQVAEIRVSRMVDGGFSGSWYNPERSGHGFVIDVTSNPDGSGARAMVSWYAYQADGSGDQMWLVGVGPVVGDTAIVDLEVTEGATFGANFDSTDVMKTLWGQVKIKFTDCTTAHLSYESVLDGFGSGDENLTRLTSGPVDYNGACQQ